MRCSVFVPIRFLGGKQASTGLIPRTTHRPEHRPGNGQPWPTTPWAKGPGPSAIAPACRAQRGRRWRRRQRSPHQRRQYGATLIGEHEARRRVIALDQILTSMCWAVAWATPAFTQFVPEARQNSSARSGTVGSAAMVPGLGALGIV